MSGLILNISIIGMLTIFVIVVILIFFPIKLNINQLNFLWFTFIISLAIFSFFAEPIVGADLWSHYYDIDCMRDGIKNIKGTSPLFVWTLWEYIVSLTSNNGWLPFSAVLIFGYLIAKVVNDYLRKNKYSSQQVIIYYLAVLGSCYVYYIVSGIRNAVAFALWMYFYYFFYKKKRGIYYLACIFILFLHLSPIIIILINFIYERFLKDKKHSIRNMLIIYLGVLCLFNLSFIPRILSNSSISFLNLIGSKWLIYLDYNISRISMYNLVRLIGMIYMLALSVYLIYKKRKLELFDCFIFFTFIFNSIIILFERVSYMVGICSFYSIIQCGNLLNARWKKNLFYITSGMIFLFQVLFSFYAMFPAINFNGHSYYEVWRMFNIFK